MTGITVHPARGLWTDRSGAITAGGTTQAAAAANDNRRYLVVQNPIAEAETLFVNVGGDASTTAANCIELAPGARWEPGPQFMPTGAVHVTAATTGHKFICKEA